MNGSWRRQVELYDTTNKLIINEKCSVNNFESLNEWIERRK